MFINKPKQYSIDFKLNFARFGEATEYLSKRNDYQFGITLSRINRTLKINEDINSSHVCLNDSLMYFKDEQIKFSKIDLDNDNIFISFYLITKESKQQLTPILLNIKKYSIGKEKEELLTLGRSFIDIKYFLREENTNITVNNTIPAPKNINCSTKININNNRKNSGNDLNLNLCCNSMSISSNGNNYNDLKNNNENVYHNTDSNQKMGCFSSKNCSNYYSLKKMSMNNNGNLTSKNLHLMKEYENKKKYTSDSNTKKINEIELPNKTKFFNSNKQNMYQINSPTKHSRLHLSKFPEVNSKALFNSPNYYVSQQGDHKNKTMIAKQSPTKLCFDNEYKSIKSTNLTKNDINNSITNNNTSNYNNKTNIINIKNNININNNNNSCINNNINNNINAFDNKDLKNNINNNNNVNKSNSNKNHIIIRNNIIINNNINSNDNIKINNNFNNPNNNNNINNINNINNSSINTNTNSNANSNISKLLSSKSIKTINSSRAKDNEIQIIESQDIIKDKISTEDSKDSLINNINKIYNTFCIGVIVSGLTPPVPKSSIIPQSEYFAAPCGHLACSLFPSFKPELLHTYLNKNINKKKFSNEIANLCFPLGIKPCFENEFDPNPQQTFYNITENEKKESYYIATLIYFTKVSSQDFILKYKFNPITYYLDQKEKSANNKDKTFQKNMKMISRLLNNSIVFIPESISLISKYPFFSPMTKCLRCMISLQPEDMNNLINHLINEVPTPKKLEQIMFYIPKIQLPIVLNHEYNKFLFDPNSESNHNLSTSQINTKILLEKVSVENIIMIFQLILLEQKILFLDNNYQTLSEIAYIFLTLIYPLSWVNTFLPVLSIKTVDMIQSPTPYVMGLDEYLLKFAYQSSDIVIDNEIIIYDMMEDIFISSKTRKRIHKKEIYHEYEIFPMPDKIREYMYKELKKIKKINENKIKKSIKLAKEQEKEKEKKEKDNKDNKEKDNKEKEKDELMSDEEIDNEIRMVFIKSMIMLIGDYNNFSFYTEDVIPLFNKEAFIESHKEKSTQNFLTQMVNTQIFTQFLSNEMQLYINKKNKMHFYNNIQKDSTTESETAINLDSTNNNSNYELVDTSYFKKMINQYHFLLNSEEIRKRACSSLKREISKKKISSVKKLKKNNAIYINNNININNCSTSNEMKGINMKLKKKESENINDLDIGGMINPVQNDIHNQILNDISIPNTKAPECGNYSIDYARAMKYKKEKNIPNFHSNVNLSGNLFGNKSPNHDVIKVINAHSSKNVSIYNPYLKVPKVHRYLLYPYFLQKYGGDFSELTIKKIEEAIEAYLVRKKFTFQSQEKMHIFIISKRYGYKFNDIIAKKLYLLHNNNNNSSSYSLKTQENEKDMLINRFLKDDNINNNLNIDNNNDRYKKKFITKCSKEEINFNNNNKNNNNNNPIKENKSDNNLFSWNSLNSLSKSAKNEDIELIKNCFKSCCTNKSRISQKEFDSLNKVLQNEENKLFFAQLIVPDIKMKNQKNHKQLTSSAFDDFQNIVSIALKFLTSNEFNTCRLLTISCFVYYKIDNKNNLIYLYENYIHGFYPCQLWHNNNFWAECFSLEFEDEKKNEGGGSLNEIIDSEKGGNDEKTKDEIVSEVALYIAEIMFKLKLSTKFINDVFQKNILDDFINDEMVKDNLISQINSLFDEL